MTSKRSDAQYSEQETQQRFEGMLRASRKVGPMPMKGAAPKRGRKARKRTHSKIPQG
jgi:hypothetical protein